MVSQARWTLVTGSVVLIYGTPCQECLPSKQVVCRGNLISRKSFHRSINITDWGHSKVICMYMIYVAETLLFTSSDPLVFTVYSTLGIPVHSDILGSICHLF